MANHASAIKRHTQSVKKNLQNRSMRSKLATQVKKANASLTSLEGSKDEIIKAQSLLAKLGRKKIIHKKAAQRRISRLMKKCAHK